jgi:hypothetical protein
MSSVVAVVAVKVGEGGELLIQVLSECIELALDCSGGWLLGCSGIPGASLSYPTNQERGYRASEEMGYRGEGYKS